MSRNEKPMLSKIRQYENCLKGMYYRLPRLDLWRTLSWVVILSPNEDDRQSQWKIRNAVQRVAKPRLEWICSLRGLGTFADAFIVSWGNFRVLDDFGHGQNFGLVWSSLSSLDVSCHEFCTGFHFCCMTCLWGLCTETTVICFAVVWRVVHVLEDGRGCILQANTSLHHFIFVWDV